MKIKNWHNVLTELLALLCILFGISTVFSMFSHPYTALSFYDGLCTALSGLSLLCINKHSLQASRVINVVIILLSLFALNHSFSIIEPNGALGFIGCACALFLLTLRFSPHMVWLYLVCIFLTISMAFLATIGSLFDLMSHFEINVWIQIPFLTALELIIVNISILSYIYAKKQVDSLPFISLLVTFLIMNMTFLGWQLIRIDEENDLDIKTLNNKQIMNTPYNHTKMSWFSPQNFSFEQVNNSTQIKHKSAKASISSLFLITGIIISILSGILAATLLAIKKGTHKFVQTRRKLANAHDRLQGIIEGSTDLIAAIDINHNLIAFNTRYQNEIHRLFKIHLKLGMNFDMLLKRMNSENQIKMSSFWARALRGDSFTVIESFKDAHIEKLDYEIRYNPIRNTKGQLIGASHIATNIHQRLYNETKLATSKKNLELMVKNLEQQNKDLELLKKLSSLLQSSHSLEDAVDTIGSYVKRIMRDTAGMIYLVSNDNNHFIKQVLKWGNPVSEVLQFKFEDCLALIRHQTYFITDSNEEVLCKHIKLHDKKPENYMCLPLLAQNEVIGLLYLEFISSYQQRLTALAHIISEQIALSLYNIKLRDDLKAQSIQDSLTGIYNRRFFEEYVHKEILKAKRHPSCFAILLIDIDSFKEINDTYGHLMGDKVLHEVASKLHENCRQSDVVARWGGEEFVIYLREITAHDAVAKAEIIRQSIETLTVTFHHVKLRSSITISIGIAIYPNHGDNIDKLISKSDEALYQAKYKGRNRVIITE